MPIDWSALVLGPCMVTFGEKIGYLSSTLGQHDILGVFDEGYSELDPLGRGSLPGAEGFQLGSPGGITAALPVLGIRLADLPFEPEQGDRVVILGNIYVVKEVRPDGKGGAKLLLNLVQAGC